MKWHEVRRWFAVDGALRDIWVHETGEADWDKLIAGVSEWGYDATWSVGGLPCAAPARAADALSAPELPMLSIRVGSATVNLHFFEVGEIELDIDPREIQSEAVFLDLQEFLGRVGDLLRKPVHVALEGVPEEPFLVYYPVTRAFVVPGV